MTITNLKWFCNEMVPTNPHLARVVDCDPFSLCVIHKGLCPSSGDINRLMMIVMRGRHRHCLFAYILCYLRFNFYVSKH
jgi:hypothetical protein